MFAASIRALECLFGTEVVQAFISGSVAMPGESALPPHSPGDAGHDVSYGHFDRMAGADAPIGAPRGHRLAVREAFCGVKPEFRTDYARERRNKRRRARYRLANAQVTKRRWAFFSKPPVADLGEREHACDDTEDMRHATADLGPDTVTGTPDLVYDALIPVAAMGEVAGLGGVFLEDIGLALIR